MKTSTAAYGTQDLSWGTWPQVTARVQPTQGVRSRGMLGVHSPRRWALEGVWTSGSCSPMAQVEEAKGRRNGGSMGLA